MRRFFIIWLVCCCSISIYGQSPEIDSLLIELKKSKADTNRVKVYNSLSLASYNNFDYEGELKYAEKALDLAKKLEWTKGVADAYCNITSYYLDVSQYEKAILFAEKSLKQFEKIKSNKGVAKSLNLLGLGYYYNGDFSNAVITFDKCIELSKKFEFIEQLIKSINNKGLVYDDLGKFDVVLENYFLALKYADDIDNLDAKSGLYTNIGNLYIQLHEYQEAIKYQRLALSIGVILNNKQYISSSLCNIGIIYNDLLNFDSSLFYFNKAINIRIELKDTLNAHFSNMIGNIGVVYLRTKQYLLAEKYIERGKKIDELVGNTVGYLSALSHLGYTNLFLGDLMSAKSFFSSSLKQSLKLNLKREIKEAYLGLSRVDSAQHNYKSAYENYKLFIIYRDSLISKENSNKMLQASMQYEFDKKAAADSVANAKQQEIKNAEIAKHKAEINAKRNQQYFLFGGLGLVIVFALFMYNRFKITARQKKEIEEQKLLVDEKQKEILDSIRYAKRIQMALLPGDKYIEKKLKRK